MEIRLLKFEIEDTPLPDHDKVRKAPPPKEGGFQAIDLAKDNVCDACKKTVFVAERMGAGGKTYHKSCFKCHTCGAVLNPSRFCSVDGLIFCDPHYQRRFQEKGGKF